MNTEGGFLISQVKLVGGRAFDRLLTRENVDAFNGAQGKILYVLWQEDRLPIVELSRRVGLANTTLTSMLDRMEAAALVRRLPAPGDRRKTLIALTDRARALEKQYSEISQEMNELYYQGFTEAEVRQFEQYLRRILVNLQTAADVPTAESVK